MKKLFWACWERLAQRAARSYVVGPHLDDALNVCRQVENERGKVTIGYWDSGDESADHVTRACCEAILALNQQNLGAYLSLKAPALGFDPDRFQTILNYAR